ncbi:MAG: prepilin peptidase [Verrucomicrobiota bacterium]
MSSLTIILHYIYPFLVGACVGSFINVIVYRLPLERSIVRPGSHCAACGKPLKWYHNIPIFSWLALKGRAACCETKIDKRYPLIELLTALFTVLLWNVFPADVAVVYLLFTYALIVGTFIDLDHFIIPDSVSLGGCVFGVIASLVVPEIHETVSRPEALKASVLGLVIGGGGLWLISFLGKLALRKDAMGLGDVKLIAAIGALSGWQGVLITIGSASIMGSIIGLAVILGRNRKTGVPIPFGPFLAAGFIFYILKGREWVDNYLNFIGFH